MGVLCRLKIFLNDYRKMIRYIVYIFSNYQKIDMI